MNNDPVYLIQRLLFCVCLVWSPCLQRQIEVTTVLEKLREVMSAVVSQEWSAASMTALLQLVSTLQSILSVSQSFSSLQALLVEARFLDALLNVLEQSVVSFISVIREPTNFRKPFENVFIFVQKRSLHFYKHDWEYENQNFSFKPLMNMVLILALVSAVNLMFERNYQSK